MNVTAVTAATCGRCCAGFYGRVREIVVEEGWREKLQDLAARRKQSWPLLALVGGATLLALAIGGRESSARIAPPARPEPQASPSSTAVPAAGVVYVHVAGAVRQPGLYEFPAGARVADAIESAGGPASKADLDALNLAELLVDGMKVDVVRRGEAMPPAGAWTAPQVPPAPSSSPVAIPLNSADQVALETIPGIGPVTAAAILKHRDEIGGFRSLEQLLDVDGIGPATFESIRSYFTL